jgi:hypothetical protein
VIPAAALLESFAVLTRMPVRLSPQDARRLLEESFSETAEIAGLAVAAAWSSIRDLSLREMGGGIIYDALIARTAFDAARPHCSPGTPRTSFVSRRRDSRFVSPDLPEHHPLPRLLS